jgi:LPXTG-motif cell wall-anchored protein
MPIILMPETGGEPSWIAVVAILGLLGIALVMRAEQG